MTKYEFVAVTAISYFIIGFCVGLIVGHHVPF
jgi:hypothetical protein